MKQTIGIILIFIGLIAVCYAGINQMILSYNLFGVIINSDSIIIPHISLIGYVGVIPLVIGEILIRI